MAVIERATLSHLVVPESLDLVIDRALAFEDSLAKHGLVPIYINDDISVLAHHDVSPGDIVLMGDDSDLVLRTQEDGLSFLVVGKAPVVDGYGVRIEDPVLNDICWNAQPSHNSKGMLAQLALEISNEDAGTS